MKQIPNLFTLLNLVFGCVAIVYIFKNDGFLFSRQEGSFSLGLVIASVFIFLAALVDFWMDLWQGFLMPVRKWVHNSIH